MQTLAKVVAAIVKFTPEQTRKIVEREEQRQSLVSSFPTNIYSGNGFPNVKRPAYVTFSLLKIILLLLFQLGHLGFA